MSNMRDGMLNLNLQVMMNSALSDIPVEPVPRRAERKRRPPTYYGEWANSVKFDIKEPQTFSQALDSPDKQHWMNAMENEMDSLYDNDVWDLVELPTEKQSGVNGSIKSKLQKMDPLKGTRHILWHKVFRRSIVKITMRYSVL